VTLAFLVASTVCLALLGTWLLRADALRRNRLDIPNERSSHDRPIPRGGGLAIVAAFFVGLLVSAACGTTDRDLLLALLGGGGIVAAAGFADDRRHIPVALRLPLHLLAAVWALYWLGGWPRLDLGFAHLAWGVGGYAIGALGLVWLLNLYNFMDGIDGLAASEAVFVAAAGAALAFEAGASPVAPLLLAAAAGGFLALNWPPARIFMGDVGSGFLGYALGVLALASAAAKPTLPWAWLILLGVFVVDATMTFARRLLRGERWWTAHRSHAYQRAARAHGGHLQVTSAVLAIDALWLLPCALIASAAPEAAVAVAAGAYLPLLLLARRLRAGEAERK
jgi:Fuc2NAc and GlcNAc transferase